MEEKLPAISEIEESVIRMYNKAVREGRYQGPETEDVNFVYQFLGMKD